MVLVHHSSDSRQTLALSSLLFTFWSACTSTKDSDELQLQLRMAPAVSATDRKGDKDELQHVRMWIQFLQCAVDRHCNFLPTLGQVSLYLLLKLSPKHIA